MSVGHLHGGQDVLQTSFLVLQFWIQDGSAGNDIINHIGSFFGSPLQR